MELHLILKFPIWHAIGVIGPPKLLRRTRKCHIKLDKNKRSKFVCSFGGHLFQLHFFSLILLLDLKGPWEYAQVEVIHQKFRLAKYCSAKLEMIYFTDLIQNRWNGNMKFYKAFDSVNLFSGLLSLLGLVNHSDQGHGNLQHDKMLFASPSRLCWCLLFSVHWTAALRAFQIWCCRMIHAAGPAGIFCISEKGFFQCL